MATQQPGKVAQTSIKTADNNNMNKFWFNGIMTYCHKKPEYRINCISVTLKIFGKIG